MGFLSTSYPNLIEILIADGGSTDETREIVNQLSNADDRVKLIDNPNKYQSFALNRMIEIAKGEVFLRADAHCIYNEKYVEKTINALLESKAKNVGGSQRYIASNLTQAGVAMAVRSVFGNGGAKYMNENYTGFADTVFLGCFWTKDLRNIGGFNTNNITNQDSELNLRLIEKFGKSVYVDKEIKSWYFPRDSFYKLIKQYFRYGRGRFLTTKLHPGSTPIRSVLPFLFVSAMFVYLLLDSFIDGPQFFPEFSLILLIIILFESFRINIAKREKLITEIWNGSNEVPNLVAQSLCTFLVIISMQVSHFSGYLYQLLKNTFLFHKGW